MNDNYVLSPETQHTSTITKKHHKTNKSDSWWSQNHDR